MANHNGTSSYRYVPSGITPPAGSEAGNSGIQRSSKGDTGFQEPRSTSAPISAETSQDSKSPDSKEDLKFSSQPDSTAGEAKQSAERQNEESKMESRRGITDFITMASQAVLQFDTKMRTHKQITVGNMEKDIYDQVFYSILLVLETQKNFDMELWTSTQEDSTKITKSPTIFSCAEKMCSLVTKLDDYKNCQLFPSATTLIELRHAVGHANIDFQLGASSRSSAELADWVYLYNRKEKKKGKKDEDDSDFTMIYKCLYEDLCIICQLIRTAFLCKHSLTSRVGEQLVHRRASI